VPPPFVARDDGSSAQRCWREWQVDPRLVELRVSLSDASRAGQIGWNNIPYVIRSNKGKGTGTGYVVLGTEVEGVGFNLLEPLLKTSSGVVGEGFGEVEGLGSRHGWWDGWLVGWVMG
jgi:hypothetical protein